METNLSVISQYVNHMITYPSSPADLPAGTACFYPWNADMPYASEVYAVEMKKDPAKDFVILNLSDIQCHDGEAFCQVGEMAEETIDKLIKEVHPDLITLTGDNAFDQFAYLRLIEFLDAYNIPWAPCMGNADMRDVEMNEFWACYRLAHAKNCLFRYGPEDMGDGNYVINITENGKIIHSLYMMDTHHETDDEKGTHYDHLTERQMQWYEWCARGIAAEAGHTVPSTAMFHMPVREYVDAWNSILDPKTGKPTGPAATQRYCQMREGCGCPDGNNGFFTLAGKMGTALMMCGHDHTNCFAIPYRGITLCYALKTGYGCYWDEDSNGGTVVTIGSDGSPKVDFRFIDPRQSRVKKFVLDYFGVNLFAPHDNE